MGRISSFASMLLENGDAYRWYCFEKPFFLDLSIRRMCCVRIARKTMLHFVKYEPNRKMLIGNRTKFMSECININGTRHESSTQRVRRMRTHNIKDTVIPLTLTHCSCSTYLWYLRISFAHGNLSIHLKKGKSEYLNHHIRTSKA